MPISLTPGLITRRALLQTGVGAAALAALPRPLTVQLGRRPELVPPIQDPRLKALALRAIEAAKSAGATYADVRLTHRRHRALGYRQPEDYLLVAVRALVGGFWGCASGSLWTPDEVARLGREAARMAKSIGGWKPRELELAPAPVVHDEHWETPIEIDPFTVPPDELHDRLTELEIWARHLPKCEGSKVEQMRATCTDIAFASSEGSYCTQRLRRATGVWNAKLTFHGHYKPWINQKIGPDIQAHGGMPGQGLEIVLDASLKERMRAAWEETLKFRPPPYRPEQPVDVGRYDVVFSAEAMATMLSWTLGPATQLDRCLGYRADEEGTSYLDEPLEMLGSYQAGAPLLTVTANRSEPRSAAWVAWDDEGVKPEDFTLVKDGVLMDFQTDREMAGVLKDSYAKHQRPFRSHGCAVAENGDEVPVIKTPNLVLEPGKEALSEQDLLKSMGNGLYINEIHPFLDFQLRNGFDNGVVAKVVRHGEIVAVMPEEAGVLFRTPEFWKNVLALGGSASVVNQGGLRAVPALVKQVTIYNPKRQA